MCKDDHEEEIAKFDGDTIRKETVFRNELSCQFHRFDIKLMRRPSIFSKYVDAQH